MISTGPAPSTASSSARSAQFYFIRFFHNRTPTTSAMGFQQSAQLTNSHKLQSLL